MKTKSRSEKKRINTCHILILARVGKDSTAVFFSERILITFFFISTEIAVNPQAVLKCRNYLEIN